MIGASKRRGNETSCDPQKVRQKASPSRLNYEGLAQISFIYITIVVLLDMSLMLMQQSIQIVCL